VKHILEILIIIFTFKAHCFAQEKTIYNLKDDFDIVRGIKVPKLTKDKMHFKNSLEYKKILVDNKIEINKDFDPTHKVLHFSNGNLTYIDEFYNFEIKTTKYSKNMYVSYQVVLDYFPNGNLKSYRVYCNGLGYSHLDMCVGKWFKFDENSKLLKSVDFNKMYTTTFRDILKLCDKVIHKEIKTSDYHSSAGITAIWRFTNEDQKSYWIISYTKYSEIIDDKKMKVIEKSAVLNRKELLYNKYSKNTAEYNAYKEFVE
jgi:hypothetical protein